MADEDKTGIEETGDADQTTGNTATDTRVGDVAAGDAAQTQDEKEETGFKSAYEAEKLKRQQSEQAEQLLRDQLTVANANQQQAMTQPFSDYDQAKANLGLAGEEYIEEAQRGKIYAEVNRITNARNEQTVQLAANRQFVSLHPDFNEVVGTYMGTQFVPSAEITELVKRKPYLSAAAFASSEGAYQIVMDERKLKTLDLKTTVQGEHLTQQGIANKLAPVSGAAAGGGAITAGAGTPTLQQQQEMEKRVESGEFG